MTGRGDLCALDGCGSWADDGRFCPYHNESICQRCGGPNAPTWHASSPLWNAVMRDPATGADLYGIVCPVCFALMAEAKGLRFIWHFGPHEDVSGLWQDSDGRVWDPESCLWQEPRAGMATVAAYHVGAPR